MYCTNCGTETDGSSKFCGNCGKPLEIKKEPIQKVFCTNCGSEMQSDSAFCTNCGVPAEGKKVDHNINDSAIQNSPAPKNRYTSKPPVKKKKGGFLKFAITTVCVVLALLILLVLFSPGGGMNPDVIDLTDFNTEFMTSGFSPESGSLGSIIAIEGENLDSETIDGIFLGDVQIPVCNITKSKVYAAVSSAVPEGKHTLIISVDGKKSELGEFIVDDIGVDSIIEEQVDASKDNVISSGNITIKIPLGVIAKSDILTVEKVKSDLSSGFPADSSEYYFVEVGDQHEFNGDITIEMPVPQEYIGNTPLVTYFNDERGTWEPMESEVASDGNLRITTSHLTPLGIVWGYDCIKSQDGFFSVYYDSDDTKINAHGNKNPASLANEVTLALVEARSKYDSLLGSSYKLNDGLTSQYVIVHSGYSEDGGSYSWKSSIIYLPGEYDTEENVKTTAAHELFHAYQDEQAIGLTMGANLWWTEAMAEYASKKVAFGIIPEIWTGSLPSETITTVDTVHEYSMSAFIDYMLNKHNVSFLDLHKAYINTSAGSSLSSFTKVFYPNGNGSLALDFMDFWQMAFTNSSAIYTDKPENMLSSITYVREKPVNSSVKVKLQTSDCQEIIGFVMNEQFDNVPERYIKVYSRDADFDVAALVIKNDIPLIGDNSTTVSECIIKNMQPGGIKWDTAIKPEIDRDYSIYKTDVYDILLLSIMDPGTHNLQAREVLPYSEEKELKNIKVGETTVIRYGFENIFAEAESLLVETDFGDGTTDTQTYDARTSINMTARHAYNTDAATIVTGSLYDTTGGKKELIGRVVIPISLDLNFTLTASNDEPGVGETIKFELNVSDPGYTYIWNDGSGDNTTTYSSIEKAYDEAGNKTMNVTVLDGTGKKIGSASCTVQIGSEATGEVSGQELTGVFNGGLTASWTESSGILSKITMTFEVSETHDGVYTFNADGTCSFGFVNRTNGQRTVYSTIYGKYELIDDFVYKSNQIDLIVRGVKQDKKDIHIATYNLYDAYYIDSEGNKRENSFPWNPIQVVDGRYIVTAAYFGAYEKE